MHDIKFTEVEEFAKNGKVILGPGLSKCGRPVLILRTRMEDKANAWEMNTRHFAYQMEMVSRCVRQHPAHLYWGPNCRHSHEQSFRYIIDLFGIAQLGHFTLNNARKTTVVNNASLNFSMILKQPEFCRLANRESPDGKVVVIIDYNGWTMAKRAPMKVSLAVLKMLQYYYPERLHQCFWWHAPAMFNTIYNLIKPFVDPVTAKKIVMLPKHDKTGPEKLSETYVPPVFPSVSALNSRVHMALRALLLVDCSCCLCPRELCTERCDETTEVRGVFLNSCGSELASAHGVYQHCWSNSENSHLCCRVARHLTQLTSCR